MITAYEDKHVRIEPADPVEVIKFVMDQKDLRQADLAPYMGGKTRVSEVLNRKRGLTKSMIINLSKAFDIPKEALINAKGLVRILRLVEETAETANPVFT